MMHPNVASQAIPIKKQCNWTNFISDTCITFSYATYTFLCIEIGSFVTHFYALLSEKSDVKEIKLASCGLSRGNKTIT